MAKRVQKEKCLTCHHPLSDHYGEYCLYYHSDLGRRCRCAEGSDGLAVKKKFEKTNVSEVLLAGENFVIYRSDDGKVYRWMYSLKQNFPVEL